jgi:hypothetical protein
LKRPTFRYSHAISFDCVAICFIGLFEMQRRDFLLCSAALAAGSMAAAAVSAKPPKRLWVTVVPTDNGNVAKVTGPPDRVRAFVEEYQTQLWPEWRTHKNDLARKQMQRLKADHDKGFGLVSANKAVYNDALLKAAAIFAVPIGVVS